MEDSDGAAALGLLLFALALSILASLAQAALVLADRGQAYAAANQGRRSARRLIRFLEEPHRTQVVLTGVRWLSGGAAASALIYLLVGYSSASWGFVVVSLLGLIMGGAVGYLLARWVLGLLDQNARGQAVLPPAIFATQGWIIGLSILCLVLASLAAILLAVWSAGRLKPSDVLRSGD